jgi:hypothetical protein
MIETKQNVEPVVAREECCSPVEAFAICAIFVILTALAIYLMFADPQVGSI